MKTSSCHIDRFFKGSSEIFVTFESRYICAFLKTGSLDNAIQDFLLAEPLWYMSQYTIIYKYGKPRTRQLKFKKELKNVPLRNNGGQRKLLPTGVE